MHDIIGYCSILQLVTFQIFMVCSYVLLQHGFKFHLAANVLAGSFLQLRFVQVGSWPFTSTLFILMEIRIHVQS